MIRYFIICFSILIMLNVNMMFGQHTDSALIYKLRYDSLYGMDPGLFNGIRYFPEHSPVRGFPFWKAGTAMPADIVLSGIQ